MRWVMWSWRPIARRLWPASSIAWMVACLARMRLANRWLCHDESGVSLGVSSAL
ncbi:hypothetical protein [Streptomyces sp. NPDC058103]|uniref:hypothetical protein n=1 Tax=Streptomyces sp. NPDC058103 TaxID=3346341 RepID=UPI0036E25343